MLTFIIFSIIFGIAQFGSTYVAFSHEIQFVHRLTINFVEFCNQLANEFIEINTNLSAAPGTNQIAVSEEINLNKNTLNEIKKFSNKNAKKKRELYLEWFDHLVYHFNLYNKVFGPLLICSLSIGVISIVNSAASIGSDKMHKNLVFYCIARLVWELLLLSVIEFGYWSHSTVRLNGNCLIFNLPLVL